MEKKITRKDMFTSISDFLVQNNASEEMVDFINHQIELVSRKATKADDGKPSKAQVENAELSISLLEEMEIGAEYSGEDILNTFEFAKEYNETHDKPLTNSKVVNIMKILVEGGQVEKTMVKRKTIYKRVG